MTEPKEESIREAGVADIVQRLRKEHERLAAHGDCWGAGHYEELIKQPSVFSVAADEIERLRAPASEEDVERVARAIVRARGADIVASDAEWPPAVAHYRKMAAEHGETYTCARSLITDAFRDARAALAARREG